jgi:hypothetical protein
MNNESENKRIDLTQFEGMVEGPWTAGLSRNIHTFKETGVVRNEQWQLIGEGFTVNKPTLLAVAAVPDLIAELKKRYEEIDALLGTIGSWGYVMCPRSNEWFEWDYGCQSEICTSHDDDCRELV